MGAAANLRWEMDPKKFEAPPGYVHPERRPRLIKSFERLARPYNWSTNQGINEVVKALGTQSYGGMFGDATPLRLENLDGVMTSVLFKKPHLKLFNSLPRVPAAQIVFQWLVKLGYGTQRGNRGFKEGGVPSSGVSSWKRGTSTVRYTGVRRGYTHQMITVGQMGGSYIDPVTSENIDGTLELLGGLERDIIFGDATIPDGSGNQVNYDGLLTQMLGSVNSGAGLPGNVINMAGQPMSFENLEDYALQLVTNGKLQTFENIRTIWSPQVLTDYAKLRYQSERILLPNAAPGYRPGTPIEGFRTQHGYFPFEESIFFNPVENGGVAVDANGNPIADQNAPAAPVITSATPSASGGTMPTGTYYYFVSSFNDNGESLTTASGAVSVTGPTGSVAIVIAATTGACGYRIYRGTVNNATDPSVGWVGTVCAGFPLGAGILVGTPGNGATFTDINTWIPGNGMGFIINFAEEDIAMAQLAPLIKFPLAVVSTTQEFILMLYHVPIAKALPRIIFFTNIGRRT